MDEELEEADRAYAEKLCRAGLAATFLQVVADHQPELNIDTRSVTVDYLTKVLEELL